MATAAKKTSKASSDPGDSATSLNFILKRMERLVGAAGFQTLTFSPLKTRTLLSAQLPGAVVETVLGTKLEGLAEAWNFQYGTLLQAVTGRTSEDLTITNGALYIKASRYKAQLIGSQAASTPRVEKVVDPTCTFTTNSELRALMKDGLAAVHLQKTMAALPDITIHVSLKKKTAHLITFDRSQMVSYVTANTSGQVFEMTLPLPRVEAIFRDGLGEAEFNLKDGIMSITDGSFKMSASLPPAEEASGVPVDRVIERAAALRDNTLPRKVGFARADLMAFLENAKALSKTSALLDFNIGTEEARVTISADGNKISAMIACRSKAAFNFLLDISYLQSILSKSKDDVEITMDDNSFIFKSGDLIYAAVLSSPPEKAKASAKKGKPKVAEEEED